MAGFCALCCFSSKQDADNSAERRTAAMMEHFERVSQRPELDQVVSDQMRALFQKFDVGGSGSITVKDIEALCVGFGQSPPNGLRDFKQDDVLSFQDFDVIMRAWFAEDPHNNIAVEHLLVKHPRAVSWADECWNLGVDTKHLEDGRVIMFLEAVVKVFARKSIPGMSENAIKGKIVSWNQVGGAGALTQDEFQFAYLYFLWILYKETNIRPTNIVLDDEGQPSKGDDSDGCSSDGAAEKDAVSCAMSEQLEKVCSEIQSLVQNTFDALFKKLDKAGRGEVLIKDAKALFLKWGQAPPYKLRTFDANRNYRLGREEFDTLMTTYLSGKPHVVADCLFADSDLALSWAEACWELGVSWRATEKGEPTMPAKTVVDLFVRAAEVNGTTQMTEREARLEISKWDLSGTSMLRFKEFQRLYFHLCWEMYEVNFTDQEDRAPGNFSEYTADDRMEGKLSEIAALAMKKQLQRARLQLCDIVDEQISALFLVKGEDGRGCIHFDAAKAMFAEMGVDPPEKMKVFDFNRNRRFETEEFDALMKMFFIGKSNLAVEYLLMYNATVVEWAEESWALGIKNPIFENAEACMPVDIAISLFHSMIEINEDAGMSDEEVKAEIRKFDTDQTGTLTIDEYAQLYMYFLWSMYEDVRDDASAEEEPSEADEVDDEDPTSLTAGRSEADDVEDRRSASGPADDAGVEEASEEPSAPRKSDDRERASLTARRLDDESAEDATSTTQPDRVASDVAEAKKPSKESSAAKEADDGDRTLTATAPLEDEMVEDSKADAHPECAASPAAPEAKVCSEICTLAMKEQLEKARSHLYVVVDEQIRATFQRIDEAGTGSVPMERVKEFFAEMGQAAPQNLKAFDFNRNRTFEIDEFDAVMKMFFAGKGHVAVDHLLMHNSTALSLSEESWKLGVNSTDLENGEPFMRVDVVFDLFCRVAEINQTPGMTEKEIHAEIDKYDADDAGSLSFKEYTKLYLYFLWVMYEDKRDDASAEASSAPPSSEADKDDDEDLLTTGHSDDNDANADADKQG